MDAHSAGAKSTVEAQLSTGRLFYLAALGFFILLSGVARFYPLTDVLIGGKLYFTDADCYSRMSRVQLVSAAPGTVLRWQGFENWPEGVFSHATAPFDYVIVGLERVLRLLWPSQGRFGTLSGETLDLAGALISPLFGVLLTLGAAVWARGVRMSDGKVVPLWWSVPLLVAVSPPLVHATVLGRPDHQSLLLLLLGVALGAEQRLLGAQRSVAWAWAGGLAWGGALWVSLYEPLVLGTLCLVLSFLNWRLAWKERLHWIGAISLVLSVIWRVEPISLVLPESIWKDSLARWGGTIGELQHLERWSDLHAGTGLLLWIAPFALVVSGFFKARVAWWWLVILGTLTAFTCFQIRWSPYCVLVFAGSLPWILAVASSRWQQLAAWWLSLLPLATTWEQMLFPSPQFAQRHHLDRAEWIGARYCALRMRSQETQPFLAAWWLSPALAYWSGQPAVAGSSHEGISGIMDTARFFLSTDPREARELLLAHSVYWVVASDSLRLIENSSELLGRAPTQKPLAERLWQPDPGVEWALEGESNVTLFRLLRPSPLSAPLIWPQ